MNQSIDGPPPMIGLQEAIEFIWREADLLDRHDYNAWLALWTEEGRYVIPIDRGDVDPETALNVAYDDATMREARVKRLSSAAALSAAPSAPGPPERS